VTPAWTMSLPRISFRLSVYSSHTSPGGSPTLNMAGARALALVEAMQATIDDRGARGQGRAPSRPTPARRQTRQLFDLLEAPAAALVGALRAVRVAVLARAVGGGRRVGPGWRLPNARGRTASPPTVGPDVRPFATGAGPPALDTPGAAGVRSWVPRLSRPAR
jgi:hypothetical protein